MSKLSLNIRVYFVSGGRFKKEVTIEGQSNLLLIREEGGPPDAQVTIRSVPVGISIVRLWFRNSFCGINY